MKVSLVIPDLSKKYNIGHHLFFEEIKKQYEIVSEDDDPNIIITGEPKWTEDVDLSKYKALKVSIVCDYFEYANRCLRYNEFFNKNRIDVVFFRTSQSMNLFKEEQIKGNLFPNIKCFFLPFSVDINYFKNLNLEKTIDVCAIYNNFSEEIYPNRRMIKETISGMSVKSLIADKIDNILFKDYVKAINQSKIFVTSNNIYGTVAWKYYEVMACGTLLLCDYSPDFDKIGFENHIDFEIYSNKYNLIQLIKYYLKHNNEIEQIAKYGMNLVRKNHNNTIRVKQMMNMLMEVM